MVWLNFYYYYYYWYLPVQCMVRERVLSYHGCYKLSTIVPRLSLSMTKSLPSQMANRPHPTTSRDKVLSDFSF